MRATARWAAGAVVILALVGCDPALTPTYSPSSTATLRTAYLTTAPGDRIDVVEAGGGTYVARAPASNTTLDARAVIWPVGAPSVADSQTCATWTSEVGGNVQPGVAFRIRSSSGRLRAVTITRNITFGIHTAFNFHTWDTNRSGNPFSLFGQVTVPSLSDGSQLGTVPLPWHICARLLGRTASFKVWPDTRAEPAWGNSTWGGSATVPTGWEAAGTTGWYLGHLGPGGSARFDDLRTWRAG